MSFVSDISKAIEARMAALQFGRRHGILWRNVAPRTLGFLGLGRATYERGTVATVFPVVGVRFEDVYGVQVKLGAIPESKTNPTLSVPLHYLVPEKPEYRFRVGTDPREEVERLASHIREYALPFYERNSTIDGALESLAAAGSYLSGGAQFTPAVYYLRGDYPRALEVAEREAAVMDKTRGNGKVYQQFLAGLRAAAAQSGKG